MKRWKTWTEKDVVDDQAEATADGGAEAYGTRREEVESHYAKGSNTMSAVSMPVFPLGGSGGKGVGKSVVAALLCEALAQRELRVVAVDLDLAGCNLHGLLGYRIQCNHCIF